MILIAYKITNFSLYLYHKKYALQYRGLETVEMEKWNGQDENCLLSNTHLSEKTTCKIRPLELCYTVHARGCKIYSIAIQLHHAFNIFFANKSSDVKQWYTVKR